MHLTRFKQGLNWVVIALPLFYAFASLAQVSQIPSTKAVGAQPVSNGGQTRGSAVLLDAGEMAQLEKASEERARKTHTRFISSGIKPDSPWSAYMQSWADRIEKVGNLNYPSKARKEHISANVLVTTCIQKNGALASVDVVGSSGVALMDAAAIQTIRLAAPFAPLVSSETWVDKLCITRTFEYGPSTKGDEPRAPAAGI